MPSKKPNFFAGQYLDRAAHRRKDDAWLQAALQDPNVYVVPVWRSRNLITHITGEPCAWFLQSSGVTANATEVIFLGEFRNSACFAVEIAADSRPNLESHQEYTELIKVAGSLPNDEAAVLAYARAMVLWRERHRYCGRCGARTRAIRAGHVLLCSNELCSNEQFPRLDPAIITLISDGERALLGRQADWPAGRYSTIAGFVEPGESLEDAVAREAHEETGIVIDDVHYHSSQPWPFPSSLMLGFIAHASTTAIELHDAELQDARWFSREEIAHGLVGLPPRTSISFSLIEDWYDQGAPRPLREELR